MSLERWLDRVVCGDCLEVLRELPDCSVDLCATDPPYALTSGTGATGGFMGKAWDAALPARAIWAEVLRVLKPGASCFVCAGSRQDTILGLLTDLREVGFDIQHAALSWCYATGFPKSTNVGKDIDKAAFLAWLRETPDGETQTRQELMGWGAEEVRKAASAAVNGEAPPQKGAPGNVIYSESRAGYHDPAATLQKHSSGTLLLAALQARFGDAPGVRAKVGTKTDPRYASPRKTAVFSTERRGYDDGSTTGTGSGDDHPAATITSPATPDAIAWDGWHSGSVPLKPSSEQILWVTKPAEPGPARNNVKRWGTGAVNVDACRVPFAGDADYQTTANKDHREVRIRYGGDGGLMNTAPVALAPDYGPHFATNTSGRYPSNLLVTARALGDDSKYGDLDAWASEHGVSDEWMDAALSAGVLRVPKPSRSEKNAGLDSTKRVCYDEANSEVLPWESTDQSQPIHPVEATQHPRDITDSACGTPKQDHSEWCWGTCMPGSKYTDQSQMGTAYTTKTETSKTTESRTSNLSRTLNTNGCTLDVTETKSNGGGNRAGCVGLPSRSTQDTTPERTASAPGARSAASSVPSETSETERPLRASHPTVKPVTLFAFLCTLACPRGGVVLDPFGGSGTTGVAAIQSGMHWVLIEREAEYCTIAEARTAHATAARRQSQPALALEAAT